MNKKVVESLIKSGAFDAMGPSRRAMIEALDVVFEQAANFQREKKEGQFNLFAAECVPGEEANFPESRIPDIPEWDNPRNSIMKSRQWASTSPVTRW